MDAKYSVLTPERKLIIQKYAISLEIPILPDEHSKTITQALKLAGYGENPIKEPY